MVATKTMPPAILIIPAPYRNADRVSYLCFFGTDVEQAGYPTSYRLAPPFSRSCFTDRSGPEIRSGIEAGSSRRGPCCARADSEAF
jgi:hypothetical protein